MPTKPTDLLRDLLGPGLSPTGLQDAYIIGRAFSLSDDLAAGTSRPAVSPC